MTSTTVQPAEHPDESGRGLGRRRFLGYVLGGSTLVTAADLSLGRAAHAAGIKSAPQVSEIYDLEDLQTDAALPTAQLIQIEINRDGTASFAIPRMEVGQGIVTSTAMIIAEELDLPVEKVRVTLAPARPELLLNQLTGGSNTTFSTYTPIRVAAALARGALIEAALPLLEANADRIQVIAGTITNIDTGESIGFGDLSEAAAWPVDRISEVVLKEESDFTVIGTPRNRTDARAAVTGAKEFSMDLDIPGALPTMVCRPPTLNGTPERLLNRREVMRMDGVTHVAKTSRGIAVRARTFGQCIDAIRAMKVSWNAGSVEGESDETILAELRGAELPFTPLTQIPDLPLGNRTLEIDCEFMFRSSAALEPYAAIASVTEDSAEIWGGLKVPILAQQDIAQMLGMSQEQVTVNVITGGGSFGHKLFSDHAIEAAECSRAFGNVPVRLMWHRADEPRQGRLHPMVTSRVRAATGGGLLGGGRKVYGYEQRNTSVVTDFSHGLGEMITSISADDLPLNLGELTYSQSIFLLTQELGYDFGAVTQLLNEVDDRFNTGSMRNIYSPDTRVAAEMMVDALAKDARMDPMEYRLEFLRNENTKRALRKVCKEGNWGRTMPPGTAQGIAIHREYKGTTACLVEIDCRPATVNRKIREAVTGPRVTKGVFAVDAGLVINPRGLEAQMMGGFADGLALTLTSSVHLKAGHFLEASWDNYFYTRQWNIAPEFEVHVLESDRPGPGGAGEAGVAATAAATANAYVRAMRIDPTKQTMRFPVNHDTSLSAFTPKSFVPPVPVSPTNGLKLTR
ncbi:Isoquinoline 1-oxidoreductase subunit beta [Nocardioides aquaticus]|uniref:Isoquinoline 1-oxidoreductase subunit beta n=2 Tax=Actinomycetes TaxID=1760 RepID=A0ABX8ECS1_9ACTN|nr:molybdopterin cofactor-binding domain-containing protein [Nocardioides aquaticus]QVT78269.1 Isoquinoline 1-oxidoreductase subunit beta [Nocardioides aquaticus]